MITKLARGSYPTAERHRCGNIIYLVVGWWDTGERYCYYCQYFLDGTPTEFPGILIQEFGRSCASG